jgi:hypothetical protein
MKQEMHTAINWLSRIEIVDILESRCGMACYDDEPTDELRDTLREAAECSGEEGEFIREGIIV